MHEFSLAQGLFTQLRQLAATNQAKKIITVRVEIGKLSGIVVDSFSFGFEVLAQESDLTKNAVLEITEIDPQHRCLDCGTISPHTDPATSLCPQCSSSRLVYHGGDELILTQIEME